MSLVIGIDVGTTTAKVIAVDPASSWHVAAYREYRLAEPHPRWQVQDPGMVLGAVDEALAEVVTACGDRPVSAIGVGSAMHGLIGRRSSSSPMRPCIAEPTPVSAIGVGSAMHGSIGLDEDLRPITDRIN